VESKEDGRIAIAGATTLVGMALVILARLVRPLPAGVHPITPAVVGSLPNFGAGLGLPSCVAALQQRFRRVGWIHAQPSVRVICIGVFAILVMWEYAQLALWGIRVDVNDLVASGIGAALAAMSLLRYGGYRNRRSSC
jgi:hypothetical protein